MFRVLVLCAFFVALQTASEQVELRVQAGHAGGAKLLAVDESRSVLASSGPDGVIILWEVASGLELRTLAQLAAPAAGIGFHGRAVLAADVAGGLGRWPLDGGPAVVARTAGPVHDMAVLPDGRAVVATETGIVWWTPGSEPSAVVPLRSAPIRRLAVAADGSVYAVGDGGLAGLSAGATAPRFEEPALAAPTLALSPNGRRLALGDTGKFDHRRGQTTGVRVVELIDPKARLAMPGTAPAAGAALRPGPVSRKLGSLWQPTDDLRFTADGRSLLVYARMDDKIDVVHLEGKAALTKVALPKGWYPNRMVQVADQRWLLGSHQFARPRAFAPDRSAQLEDPRQKLGWTNNLWSDASGRWLVQAVFGGEFRVWDLETARLHRRIQPIADGVFTWLDQHQRADGLVAATVWRYDRGAAGMVLLFDPASGVVSWQVEVPRSLGGPGPVASIGEGVATVISGNEVPTRVLRVDGPGLTRQVDLPEAWEANPGSAVFAADGGMVMGGLRWVAAWSPEGGPARWRRMADDAPAGMTASCLWETDGGLVAASPAGVVRFDAAGLPMHRATALAIPTRLGDWNDPTPLLTHGGAVLRGEADGSITRWGGGAEAFVVQDRLHSISVSALHRLADGTLASASHDGAVVLRLPAGGWMLLAADSHEWVVAGQDGIFDGSPGCGRLLALVAAGRGGQIDQFAGEKNRPDLLLERLGRGDPAYRRLLRAAAERRAGRLSSGPIDFANLPTAAIVSVGGGASAILTAALAAPAGLARWQVWLDGVPQLTEAQQACRGATARLTHRLTVPPGRHTVEVASFDLAGRESLRAVAQVFGPPAQGLPELHVLTVGVSRHQVATLDLAYAHQDALDLAAALARGGAGFGKVHATVVTDSQATTAGIRAAGAALARSRPQDTVVVLFAGHGKHDAEGVFHFLTHNADPERLAATSLPFAEIEQLIAAAPALRRLVLLDTCESGEREESVGGVAVAVGAAGRSRGLRAVRSAPRGLIREERFIFNDLRRRTGAVVISSSTGDQLSYERDEFANGLFTQAVLEALAGAGDADGNGRISAHELRAYVTGRVASLSGGLQTPVIDRDNIHADLHLPVLTGLQP